MSIALNTQVGGGHYKKYKIQPITFFMENRIPFAEASVIKYVLRHADKNGEEDIDKAIHILQIIKGRYIEDKETKKRLASAPYKDPFTVLKSQINRVD
jgi:hypothetical protein